MDALTFVVLAFVVYRIARFIVLDTLWEQWRDKLIEYLERPRGKRGRTPLWREKVAELIGCPFCVTVWISAGVVATWWNDWLPDWLYLWLALSTGALIVWRWVDWEED